MRELIPGHPIPAGPARPALLPAAPWPLPDPPVARIDGSTATAAARVPVPDHPGPGLPHGGEFTYRSADSDMLGWACERASGTRDGGSHPALIWQPMGAERDGEITCDPLGSGIHDGGVSATARDLARFGQMLIDDGMVRGGPGGPGRPGWPPPASPNPASGRPSRSPTTSSSCRAAGTAISSGCSRGPAARCWSASASTASWSTPTVPRARWWSSCRPGRIRSIPGTCWTRCEPAPRWPRTWRRQRIEPGRSVRADWAGRGLTVSRRLAWPPSRPAVRTAPGRATDATRFCPSSWKVSGSAAPPAADRRSRQDSGQERAGERGAVSGRRVGQHDGAPVLGGLLADDHRHAADREAHVHLPGGACLLRQLDTGQRRLDRPPAEQEPAQVLVPLLGRGPRRTNPSGTCRHRPGARRARRHWRYGPGRRSAGPMTVRGPQP